MIAPKHIVVATDFGDAATVALRYGRDFARAFAARLHVVHVVDDLAATAAVTSGTPPIDLDAVQSSLEDDARQSLDALVAAPENDGLSVSSEVLRHHQPARAVLDFAKDIQADLLIVGTHGRGGLADFFLGSVAQRVVRSAPCPVLTVRADERDFVHPDALTVAQKQALTRRV